MYESSSIYSWNRDTALVPACVQSWALYLIQQLPCICMLSISYCESTMQVPLLLVVCQRSSCEVKHATRITSYWGLVDSCLYISCILSTLSMVEFPFLCMVFHRPGIAWTIYRPLVNWICSIFFILILNMLEFELILCPFFFQISGFKKLLLSGDISWLRWPLIKEAE